MPPPRPSGQTFDPGAAGPVAPLVRIEAAAKRFGGIVALDAVTLDILPKEFFCLLGPSGCGKTTLLRMIAGFEHPDSGRILLDGADLVGTPPHRRPVNMMFQSYALFPHLSVAGNIAYGLRQQGRPRAEIAARVAEMLALVQLAGFEDRYPAQLSGGQRQRVALARALARRPRLLLLDEPLAALDRKLREETRFELKEIQHRLGTTFVVVTHDQDEAMAMADRIAVLDRGRIAQVGTPKQIYERPASRFVAGFLGEVTIFEGEVVALEPGLVAIATPASPVPLRVAAGGEGGRLGQRLAVAVRPEAIGILRDDGSAAQNILEGRVGEVAYLGDVTLYRVVLDSGEIVRAATMNFAPGVAAPSRGDRVRLGFAPDAAVILPA